MLRTNQLFIERKRLPIEWFCLVQVSLSVFKRCQVSEIYADFVMLCAIFTLEDCQRPKIERLGLLIFPLSLRMDLSVGVS